MMFFKKRTICASALVLAGFCFPLRPFPVLAAGDGAGVPANPKTAATSVDKTLVHTLFIELTRVNCPDTIGSTINNGIRDRLKRVPHCYLVPDDEIRTKGLADISDCHEKKCAVKFAKQLDCKKALIGSITRVTRSKREQMGDEGEFKYLYEVKPYDVFIIKLDLIDASENSITASFTERAKKNEVNAKLDSLAARLKGYFAPIPPPEPPRLTPWIGVSLSCLIPNGRFAKIIGAAGGITIDAGLKHIALPNIYAKISGSYYFASKKKESVRSYQSGQLSVLGGYSFPLPKGFSITPMAGAGCQFHTIRDYKYTLPYLLGRPVRTDYYDPLIAIRCEGAYAVYRGLQVTITPGYTVFFEKGMTGHYVNIDAGVKYEFDIKAPTPHPPPEGGL
jgi:hypothetical protein